MDKPKTETQYLPPNFLTGSFSPLLNISTISTTRLGVTSSCIYTIDHQKDSKISNNFLSQIHNTWQSRSKWWSSRTHIIIVSISFRSIGVISHCNHRSVYTASLQKNNHIRHTTTIKQIIKVQIQVLIFSVILVMQIICDARKIAISCNTYIKVCQYVQGRAAVKIKESRFQSVNG